MKCPKCAAEWIIPPNISKPINNCPFCGESLISVSPSKLDTVDDVLKEILTRFGIDVFNDGQKTIALFSDLAPRMKRERLLLSYLIQSGGNRKLLEVRNRPAGEQQACFQQVLNYLVDEQFVAEDAAQVICLSFSTAVGLSVKGKILERNNPLGSSSSESVVTPSPFKEVPSSTTHVPASSTSIISNYAEYKVALEKYYISFGKKPLTDSQIMAFIAASGLDQKRVSLSYVKKSLQEIYAKYGNKPAPASIPTRPASPTPSPKIKSYPEYLKALEAYYNRFGPQPLTESQIRSFISSYSLDRDWKISVIDVQKDLAVLYSKHAQKKPPTPAPVKPAPPPPPSFNHIRSYEEYQVALENYYVRLGKVPLSESQIRYFLTSNSLDRDWNITISEIMQDLIPVYSKYNTNNTNSTSEKHLFRFPWHKK